MIFLKICSFGTKKQEHIHCNYPNLPNFGIVIEHLFTVTDGRDGWTLKIIWMFMKAFAKNNGLYQKVR